MLRTLDMSSLVGVKLKYGENLRSCLKFNKITTPEPIFILLTALNLSLKVDIN